MEYVICKYNKKNKLVHVIGIHLPLQNAENATSVMFLVDLSELFTDKLMQLENIILLGDFNMHIEEIMSLDTIIFNNTLVVSGLTQHITKQMHNKGNILDLVFTELDSKSTITGCRAST